MQQYSTNFFQKNAIKYPAENINTVAEPDAAVALAANASLGESVDANKVKLL